MHRSLVAERLASKPLGVRVERRHRTQTSADPIVGITGAGSAEPVAHQAAAEDDSPYSPGATPVSCRNARLKYAASLNPTEYAIDATDARDIWRSPSSLRASARRRARSAPDTVSPCSATGFWRCSAMPACHPFAARGGGRGVPWRDRVPGLRAGEGAIPSRGSGPFASASAADAVAQRASTRARHSPVPPSRGLRLSLTWVLPPVHSGGERGRGRCRRR
jgi:hypothetical protein